MIGAIIGDIVGSYYEWENTHSVDIPIPHPESRYTDDTVLTAATAHCVVYKTPYDETYQDYALRHPGAGYGGMFKSWMYLEKLEPYNSWGNGSAMRVSPIGFAFATEKEVREKAQKSAEVTHNHPEGIKGALAIALSIFWAKVGKTKAFIKEAIQSEFGYDLNRKLDEIRPTYEFDSSCQGSVPEAIIAFLESEDFDDAIRFAISLGGDSDTIACMSGGIAQAYYKKIPYHYIKVAHNILPPDLRGIMEVFHRRFKPQF